MRILFGIEPAGERYLDEASRCACLKMDALNNGDMEHALDLEAREMFLKRRAREWYKGINLTRG